MVSSCCICRVERGSLQDFNFAFHRLPKNEDLKLKWLKVIGRKVYRNALVCSKHFKAEDYKNYDDLNLIRKILKPSAVPSIHIKSSKEHILESSENSLSDVKDFSTDENKNEESFEFVDIELEHENSVQDELCNDRLQVNRSSISTSKIDNPANKKALNEATLHFAVTQAKERKIKSNVIKSLKKQRYQNGILGIVRKDDFISDNAWLKFQNYINHIKKQYRLLLQKNRKLLYEINNFRDLLKKQLSDDI